MINWYLFIAVVVALVVGFLAGFFEARIQQKQRENKKAVYKYNNPSE